MEPSPPSGSSLPRDVLIVEDDPIIALDLEDTMLGFGVQTVRSVGSVATALAAIASQPPDCALLDIGLASEKSFAVAQQLESLNIPFIFVTGYGAGASLPEAVANRPRLGKPCSAEALEAALRQAMRSA